MKVSVALILVLAGTLCAEAKQCGMKNPPLFADFGPSSRLKGKPAEPVLRTTLERNYRAIIRSAAKRGPNFDGHYAVAVDGCGTGCHGFFVIDLRSGTVFSPPFKNISFHTPPPKLKSDPDWWCFPKVVEFRLDSDLLIVEGCLDGHQCGHTFYRMEGTGLRQIDYYPDQNPKD